MWDVQFTFIVSELPDEGLVFSKGIAVSELRRVELSPQSTSTSVSWDTCTIDDVRDQVCTLCVHEPDAAERPAPVRAMIFFEEARTRLNSSISLDWLARGSVLDAMRVKQQCVAVAFGSLCNETLTSLFWLKPFHRGTSER